MCTYVTHIMPIHTNTKLYTLTHKNSCTWINLPLLSARIFLSVCLVISWIERTNQLWIRTPMQMFNCEILPWDLSRSCWPQQNFKSISDFKPFLKNWLNKQLHIYHHLKELSVLHCIYWEIKWHWININFSKKCKYSVVLMCSVCSYSVKQFPCHFLLNSLCGLNEIVTKLIK